jgi:acyl-homoserine-lactone acylase
LRPVHFWPDDLAAHTTSTRILLRR